MKTLIITLLLISANAGADWKVATKFVDGHGSDLLHIASESTSYTAPQLYMSCTSFDTDGTYSVVMRVPRLKSHKPGNRWRQVISYQVDNEFHYESRKRTTSVNTPVIIGNFPSIKVSSVDFLEVLKMTAAIKRGKEIHITIDNRTWSFNLKGSRKAIDEVLRLCSAS